MPRLIHASFDEEKRHVEKKCVAFVGSMVLCYYGVPQPIISRRTISEGRD